MSNANSLAQMYQKKTDKEHILSNPDTYVGSADNVDNEVYVFDDKKITQQKITMNPALYKLFDEAIVNCRDHAIRMKTAIETCKANTIPLSNIEVTYHL